MQKKAEATVIDEFFFTQNLTAAEAQKNNNAKHLYIICTHINCGDHHLIFEIKICMYLKKNKQKIHN